MNQTSWIVFHKFLQKCNLEKRDELVSCLPEDKQILVKNFTTTFGDPSVGFEGADVLNQVHYSWLAPLIRSRSEDEIRLFLSALNPEQVKGLKKALLFTNGLYTLSHLGQKFIRSTLVEEFLGGKEVLPLACLPEDPLNELLSLNTERLVLLTSFLGLRDLSVEMRLIIDTSKIKQIMGILSQHEQLYLKMVTQQKEPIVFKPMGLAKWDGDPKGFKTLLLQRGMNRLAKALNGHNESLIWYVTHKFDTEKGKTLTAFCTPVERRASSILSFQVADLIPNIQNLRL